MANVQAIDAIHSNQNQSGESDHHEVISPKAQAVADFIKEHAASIDRNDNNQVTLKELNQFAKEHRSIVNQAGLPEGLDLTRISQKGFSWQDVIKSSEFNDGKSGYDYQSDGNDGEAEAGQATVESPEGSDDSQAVTALETADHHGTATSKDNTNSGQGGEAGAVQATTGSQTVSAGNASAAQEANLAQPRTNASENKLVMLAYSPWHANGWMRHGVQAGVTPDIRDEQGNLIPYDPMDPRVREWERDQFMKAGIDTLVMDWSNNSVHPKQPIADMETATAEIAEYYSTLEPGTYPKIAIMIGTPTNQTPEALQQKAEQVRGLIQKYPNVFQTLTDTDGEKKPLLLNYTPSQDEAVKWDDKSFNVVNMTGWADERLMPNTASWEQRGIKPTEVEGKTWVTVSSAYRGQGGWTDPNDRQLREDGRYLQKALEKALHADADIVFLQSWYEGIAGPSNEESNDPEATNDLVPSVENGAKDANSVAVFSEQFHDQR